MHIPAKPSFWWRHGLQRVVHLMLLSVISYHPITIGRKIKEVEHTYYLKAFADAYWRLFLTTPSLAHNDVQNL